MDLELLGLLIYRIVETLGFESDTAFRDFLDSVRSLPLTQLKLETLLERIRVKCGKFCKVSTFR